MYNPASLVYGGVRMTFLRFRIIVAWAIIIAGFIALLRGDIKLTALFIGAAVLFGVASSNPTKRDTLALVSGLAAVVVLIGFALIQYWDAVALAGLALLISYLRIRTVNRNKSNQKLADVSP